MAEVKTAPVKKASKKNRVFILAVGMRVAGPYVQEGTGIRYDIPDEYPLPAETDVIVDGVPQTIRFIPSSKTIWKQEQIEKEKRPEKYELSDEDRKLITFRMGRLEVDAEKNSNAEEYVVTAGWLKGNENARPRRVKEIYEEYDEEVLVDTAMTDKEKTYEAQKAIMAMNDTALRDLYTLSLPTGVSGLDVSPKKMKLHLWELAEKQPQWILDGAAGPANAVRLLVQKAIDMKILDPNVNGKVMIAGVDKPEPLVDLSEAGGREAKINRLITWFMTEEDGGADILPVIKEKIKAAEDAALKK